MALLFPRFTCVSRLLGVTQESAEGESDFSIVTDPKLHNEPPKEVEWGSGRRWILAAGYPRAFPKGPVTKERKVGI